MRSLTLMYANEAPKKIKFGTPSEAWHTVNRCLDIFSTFERIAQDITDFPNVLDKEKVRTNLYNCTT